MKHAIQTAGSTFEAHAQMTLSALHLHAVSTAYEVELLDTIHGAEEGLDEPEQAAPILLLRIRQGTNAAMTRRAPFRISRAIWFPRVWHLRQRYQQIGVEMHFRE